MGGVIQSTAALKDRSGQHPNTTGGSGASVGGGSNVACSFLGNNSSSNMGLGTGSAGGNGYYNMMSSSSSGSGSVDSSNSINRPHGGPSGAASNPASGLGTPGEFAAMIPGGLHIKGAKQINNEAGKNGRDNMPTSNESSDLVKDIILHAMQSNTVSPKRNSPLRTPIPPSRSPTRSRSPPTPALLHPMDQSAANACVNTSFPINPTNVPSSLEAPGNTASTKTSSTSNVASPAVPSSVDPPTAISTDRASPTNQSITSNEDSVDSNSSKSRRRRKPDRTNKMGAEELERMHEFLGGGDNSADKCDRIEGIDPMKPNIAVRNDIATLALEGISSLSQGLASDSSHSPHITDLSDSTRVNLQNLTESNSTNGEEKKSSTVSTANNLSDVAAVALESTRKDSESNSDDCETIDKIAAMISSTEDDAAVNAPRTPKQPIEPVVPIAGNKQSSRKSNGPVKIAEETSASLHESEKTELVKMDTDKSFEEVENKLEEMFAGIDESVPECSSKSPPSAEKKVLSPKQTTEPTDILIELAGKSEESAPPSSSVPSVAASSDDSPVASTSGTQKKVLTVAAKRANISKPAAGAGSPNKKKVLKKKPVQSKGASFAAAEERAASFGAKGSVKKPVTKGNGKKGNGSGPVAGKNKTKPSDGTAVVDPNGRYKGPFVQVKSDGSHLVINTPINEDDSEKLQNKPKKFVNSMNNSEKSKIRGLHVSTLSTKYDADTTDTSWMCVFCKAGPHKQRLGDLFGPYIISNKSSEFKQSQTDEECFNVKRTRESLQSKLIKQEEPVAGTSAPKSKKRKIVPEAASTPQAVPSTSTATPNTAQPPDDMFYGMIKAGDDSYEVWMHEDCLVWAPGVHIIGTRVVGLEAAIWNCCRHQCRICSHHGANVSCLYRGCNEEAHVVCARRNDWKLSDEFKSHCEKHSKVDSS